MTHPLSSRPSTEPETRLRPSEHEVVELIERAKQQYEEVMRLADLADLPDPAASAPDNQPAYSWDNPIGYVVTGSSDGDLV